MHFKTVALMALASVAIAAPNADLANRQASSITIDPTEASVLSVLLTALPSSLLQIAITNQNEVGSIIASSFSAGETPGWYSALPNDVKSYLPILYAEQTPTPSSSSVASASSTPAPSSSSSVLTVISTVVGTVSATISPSGNGTVVSTVHSPTLSATTAGSESSIASASGASGASGATAAASSTQTGGASYPTAVMGAGIAGALGFLGMLAM
ncbi:hypothetical protein BU16DRAFT_581588 [Lophium mytilinum]|uniref:GPI anchored protein n=1 Tax=Lophium mytilinum TaxID=390894 RepID=A0A6A6QWE3_9PEZI|nr:hypothetical protein BU16DRAFT_581588 [Lophium mytilinum]